MMNFTFHDYQPEFESLADAVINGLSQSPKTLHPKFFYDEAGSKLFDAICQQPEYYIPRVEQHILQDNAEEMIAHIGKQAVIIEPGAGSSIKIRYLLDRMHGEFAPSMYVPMDISAAHLKQSAQNLANDYPETRIDAICVDHTKPYHLPDDVPTQQRLFFYPGSSLGNFHPAEAIDFLRVLHEESGENGALLIGVDTKKSTDILNAAYNDQAGVTAAFNRNVLQHIQANLKTNLNPDNFTHHAFYQAEKGRIEMHLHSKIAQQIYVNDHSFSLDADESIHTENSYKYTNIELQALAHEAGWQSRTVWQDEQGLFAVYYFSAKH